MRKDVERAFGIVKKRFAILKVPFNYATRERVQNAVHSCIILHNMLLAHDGVTDMGTRGSDWIKGRAQLRARQDLDDKRIEEGRARARAARKTGAAVGAHPRAAEAPAEDDEESEREIAKWGFFRDALITHFTHAIARNEVWWLKTRRQCRHKAWLRARQRYAYDAGRAMDEEDSEDDIDEDVLDSGIGWEESEEDGNRRDAGDNDSDDDESVNSDVSADEV